MQFSPVLLGLVCNCGLDLLLLLSLLLLLLLLLSLLLLLVPVGKELRFGLRSFCFLHLDWPMLVLDICKTLSDTCISTLSVWVPLWRSVQVIRLRIS